MCITVSTRRVTANIYRRAKYLKGQIRSMLRLDTVRLSPKTAASLVAFRTLHGQTPPTETPPNMVPIVGGNTAKLGIEGVFPPVTCFVQVDLRTFAIRWSKEWFLSLNLVTEVTVSFTRQSQTASVASGEDGSLQIRYSDQGGTPRVLKLRMSQKRTDAWREGLTKLIQMISHVASPVHWRWAYSCMAKTRHRRQQAHTTLLLESDLQLLLKCANAGTSVSTEMLQETLQTVRESEATMDLPKWLKPPKRHEQGNRRMLSASQVMDLLLRLSLLTPRIADLFDRYAEDKRIGLAEWRVFCHTEQTWTRGELDDEVSAAAQTRLEEEEMQYAGDNRTSAPGSESGLRTDDGQSLLQFAQRLLSPRNGA
eukprot:1777820-Prymnesium_polylepis.2